MLVRRTPLDGIWAVGREKVGAVPGTTKYFLTQTPMPHIWCPPLKLGLALCLYTHVEVAETPALAGHRSLLDG